MGSIVIDLLRLSGLAFAVGLSGALMPGPVTTVMVAQVGRWGTWAGPLVATGHASVEALLVVALALGAVTVVQSDLVTGTIAVIGGAVLVWMGWGMIRAGFLGAVGVPADEEAPSSWGPVLGGVLASLSNPYWFVWWATVGVGYFAISQSKGWVATLTFFLGHVLADYVWLTLLALALSRGRKVMDDRVYRVLVTVLGGCLIAMALGFALYGIGRFG